MDVLTKPSELKRSLCFSDLKLSRQTKKEEEKRTLRKKRKQPANQKQDAGRAFLFFSEVA
jgi:hypothetical protein